MNDTLYLVTCDGYVDGYGIEIFLIGIFTTEEQAMNERDKAISHMKTKFKELNEEIAKTSLTPESGYYDEDIEYCEDRFRITQVRKNEPCPLKWKEHTGFVNDYYLGGYIE